ncbi:MAG: MFS transporter [Verrucomicrobiota bacterium]|jgi:FSR family fosmidomycin resistance protein-like MFS transporter|nr:MFS transporter [Verrucomicrobiota bacterium]
MTDCTFSHARQWRQLLALTFAHGVADTFVGLVAPVLEPMRGRYGVSLGALIFVASILGVSANLFQIPLGHIKTTWTRPWTIAAGVLLAGTATFIPWVPVGPYSVYGMAGLAALAGLGIAAVHPEGLRAVHGLDRITPSLSTAVFMVAGFAGFAGGAWISAKITEGFGLDALVWLYPLAPLATVPLLWSGVRMPGGRDEAPTPAPPEAGGLPAVPFWPLFAMAAVLATSSQIQATLLPTYLHAVAGYTLSFSGLSFALFGLGSMAGAVLWGALAPRLGHLRVLFVSTLAGAPLTVLYLWLAPQTKGAAALLAFTGFVVYTGFPLCVALSRDAVSSLRAGPRMGLISGGTWGIAAAALWIIGPVSNHTGVQGPLHLVWVGYLVAAVLTFMQIRKMRHT